jgi:hypothetical protein
MPSDVKDTRMVSCASFPLRETQHSGGFSHRSPSEMWRFLAVVAHLEGRISVVRHDAEERGAVVMGEVSPAQQCDIAPAEGRSSLTGRWQGLGLLYACACAPPSDRAGSGGATEGCAASVAGLGSGRRWVAGSEVALWMSGPSSVAH